MTKLLTMTITTMLYITELKTVVNLKIAALVIPGRCLSPALPLSHKYLELHNRLSCTIISWLKVATTTGCLYKLSTIKLV